MLIEKNNHLSGSVTMEGDLTVEGSLSGEIAVKGALTVKRGGKVEGTMRCTAAAIDGTLKGTLHCEGTARVGEGSSVSGRIIASEVVFGAAAAQAAPARAERRDAPPPPARETRAPVSAPAVAASSIPLVTGTGTKLVVKQTSILQDRR